MDSVAVIVPTRVLPERAALLRCALDSILSQQGVRVVPLVVINGRSADAAIVRELSADSRLRITVLETEDLPAALAAGRGLVDTPFFAELDDDDVLLPGALAARVEALHADDSCGAVVTNGFRTSAAGDALHVPDMSSVEHDPVRAMARLNWLLPGSWLCRSDAVGSWLFDRMPRYLECTWIGLQLATRVRIRFLAEPTVVWNTESPAAESRSRAFVIGQVAALERILELELPPDVRATFRRKIATASHQLADLYLHEGVIDRAWHWHLRSLTHEGGLRHLAFTRRLLWPRKRS